MAYEPITVLNISAQVRTPKQRTICTICKIAMRHNATYLDVIGPSRASRPFAARLACYRALRERGHSYAKIAPMVNREWSTVRDAMRNFPELQGWSRLGMRA